MRDRIGPPSLAPAAAHPHALLEDVDAALAFVGDQDPPDQVPDADPPRPAGETNSWFSFERRVGHGMLARRKELRRNSCRNSRMFT